VGWELCSRRDAGAGPALTTGPCADAIELRFDWTYGDDPAELPGELAAEVADSEEAISRAHTMWRAARAVSEPADAIGRRPRVEPRR
jgi:hypothetical protein